LLEYPRQKPQAAAKAWHLLCCGLRHARDERFQLTKGELILYRDDSGFSSSYIAGVLCARCGLHYTAQQDLAVVAIVSQWTLHFCD
jgi:hypothetical protein